jgi:hypothetical protein
MEFDWHFAFNKEFPWILIGFEHIYKLYKDE